MRVLVVGAAGFIGGHVAQTFAARGDEVVGVAPRFPRPHDPRLAGVRRIEGRAECLPDPVRSERFDVLVHAAGVWKPNTIVDPAVLERHCRQVFLEGTRRLGEMARRDGSHVVLVTGVVRFGAFEPGTRLSRDMPPAPSRSPYGRYKIEAERALVDLGVRWSAPCAAVVYGPHDRSSYVWSTYRAIRRRRFMLLGDGSAKSSLCSIHTLTEAVLRLSEGPGSGLLLLGDEPSPTHAELARTIARSLGRKEAFVRLPVAPALAFANLASRMPRARWMPVLPTPRDLAFRTSDFLLDLAPARALGLVGSAPSEERIGRAVHWWEQRAEYR